LNVVILLFILPTTAARIESSTGSMSFLYLMGLTTLVVNLSFNLLCYLLYFGGTEYALFYNCSGFWTIAMALITIECMYVADVPRNLFVVHT
jgi:hypothetical protein